MESSCFLAPLKPSKPSSFGLTAGKATPPLRPLTARDKGVTRAENPAPGASPQSRRKPEAAFLRLPKIALEN